MNLIDYVIHQCFRVGRRVAVKNANRPRRVRAIVALLFVGQLVPGEVIGQQVITLTGDPWPPFVHGQIGEDATSGIAVDIVNEIFQRIESTEVRFPLIPWNRALREVEEGVKDGIVLLLKTQQREQYMVYTDPIVTARNFVWYSTKKYPNGFEWKSIEELTNYTLGVTHGYSYGDEIDASIASGDQSIIEAPTVEQLFAMLQAGRLNLILCNDVVGYELASRYAKDIVPTENTTGTDVYHIAFSRKSSSSELIPTINQVIAELKDDGYVDRLLHKP